MSIAEKLTAVAENVSKVYESGRTKGWADFWDAYQNNGKRDNYHYAFVQIGWTNETFKPKYDLNVAHAHRMFQYTRITDLAQVLKDCNVVLDMSNCASFKEMFQESKVTNLPTLDMRKATNTISTFEDCWDLISIEKLIVSNTTPYGTNCFNRCSKLTHAIFEGTIGQNGLNLQECKKLDRDSITSIINALSGATRGLSVTLSKSAVNAAFGINVDDLSTWGEGTEFYNLRHSKDNWTISYI